MLTENFRELVAKAYIAAYDYQSVIMGGELQLLKEEMPYLRESMKSIAQHYPGRNLVDDQKSFMEEIISSDEYTLDDFEAVLLFRDLLLKYAFLTTKLSNKGYEYIAGLFTPISKDSPTDKDHHEEDINIHWDASKTETLELIKALIMSKSIKGTQKEIIKKFSSFLNIDLSNPDQTLQKIKNRNNGSETLFIDKLKASLNDNIKR